MPFDLVQITQLIKPHFDGLSVPRNIVLFMGNTGAGKSTTVNYLLGQQFKKGRGGLAYLPEGAEPLKAPTSHGMEAKTIYPSIYDTDNIFLCDCPGFEDNRSDEMRVAISICLQASARAATEIDAIAVVIDYRWITSERGSALRDIAFTLMRSLDATTFPHSFIFIVNRVEEDVDHDYIIEQINSVILAEQEKLHELESVHKEIKKQDDTSTPDEGFRSRMVIQFLQLMASSKERIVLINLFDNGESRESIFSLIKASKPIRSSAFDFISSDIKSVNFKKEILGSIRYFNEKIRMKPLLIERLKQENEGLKKLERDLKSVQNTLTAILSYDPASDEVTEIKAARACIATTRTAQRQNERQSLEKYESKEKISKELYTLDSKSEVSYCKAPVVSKDDGVFYNTQHFHYDDVPYTRAQPLYSNGSLRVIRDSPDSGVYEARFSGDIWANSWASIEIYCEKRLIPSNAIRIEQLKKDLTQCNKELQVLLQKKESLEKRLQSETRDLEDAISKNTERQKALADLERGKKELLSSRIQTQSQAVVEIESEISSIQSTLKSEQSYFSDIQQLFLLTKTLLSEELSEGRKLFLFYYEAEFIIPTKATPLPRVTTSSLPEYKLSEQRSSFFKMKNPQETQQEEYSEPVSGCCAIL